MDAKEAEARLAEGIALERHLRWADALSLYEAATSGLPASGEPEDHALRARIFLRRANALRELGRGVEARGLLDDALREGKASARPGLMAEALVAAGVHAADAGDGARAEAFLLDALERAHRSDGPAAVRARGWAFLNLAGLYAKTGRIDLAFVTFTKAQDVLGAGQDWGGVAAAWESQARLRRAIGDEDRWREDLAEAVVFYDKAGMRETADRLRGLLGRKLV